MPDKETELKDLEMRPQYDIPTAVTFLMAGMGIGSLLAILFARRTERPIFPSGAGQATAQ